MSGLKKEPGSKSTDERVIKICCIFCLFVETSLLMGQLVFCWSGDMFGHYRADRQWAELPEGPVGSVQENELQTP